MLDPAGPLRGYIWHAVPGGDNDQLVCEGYTVRHIETWHDHDAARIVWDAPALTDADLPC